MGYHGILWEVNNSKVKLLVKNVLLLWNLSILNLVILQNINTSYGNCRWAKAIYKQKHHKYSWYVPFLKYLNVIKIYKLKIQYKLHQMACKPGSVYLIRDGWPFIWDVCYQTPRATYPSDSAKTRYNATPIRSCSRWGLPCQNCCQFRGALLPHPFTLTWRKARRFTFCGTFPRVAPAGRYPALCPRGARTFLSYKRSNHPTVWSIAL